MDTNSRHNKNQFIGNNISETIENDGSTRKALISVGAAFNIFHEYPFINQELNKMIK